MYFSVEEEKIISKFYKSIVEIKNNTLKLCWLNGSAIARFDTCFEDEDDETEEEYNSFVFEIKSIEGNIPVDVSDDNMCIVNYRNFPISIFLGKKDILKS